MSEEDISDNLGDSYSYELPPQVNPKPALKSAPKPRTPTHTPTRTPNRSPKKVLEKVKVYRVLQDRVGMEFPYSKLPLILNMLKMEHWNVHILFTSIWNFLKEIENLKWNW